MIFTSIKGYFYKLYNICYALVLAPLALFLFLYYQTQVENFLPIIQEENTLLIIESGLFFGAIAGLTIVHFYIRKQFISIGREVSLGNKMDRYFPIALLRTSAGSIVAFLLNAGFYLTGSIWCAIGFGLTMVWIAWQWPTPKRFCNDLSVRKDERELMLNSRDAF